MAAPVRVATTQCNHMVQRRSSSGCALNTVSARGTRATAKTAAMPLGLGPPELAALVT